MYQVYWLPVIPDQFSDCDDTTMDYILVNSDAKNMKDNTGKSRSGNYIASETA